MKVKSKFSSVACDVNVKVPCGGKTMELVEERNIVHSLFEIRMKLRIIHVFWLTLWKLYLSLSLSFDICKMGIIMLTGCNVLRFNNEELEKIFFFFFFGTYFASKGPVKII